MNQFHSDKPYAVFQPKNSKKWWVRFSITGQGQQRYSLGTYDEHEAENLAFAKWNEAKALANAGLSVTRKKFKVISAEFIELIKFEVARGERSAYQAKQYPPIITNYFNKYFGNKMLTAITADDIDAYWQWRYDYWTKGDGKTQKYVEYPKTVTTRGVQREVMVRRPPKRTPPSKSTLDKEVMLLRQLFAFGQRRKYTLEIPKIKTPKNRKRVVREHPGFTLKQFLHLEQVSRQRIEEASSLNDQMNLHNKRLKLHCFCMIAGFTGLRSTELYRLRWGAIGTRELELENGQTYEAVIIQAGGKGKEREMAPLPEVVTDLNMLRELFMLEIGREPTDDDHVFTNPNGKKLKSFAKGLEELLIASGLRKTSDGRTRNSGSFRPFYISQQIREGVNQFLLIRNTGTAGNMVTKHYNKITPTETIPQLTPDWLRHRKFKR